MSMFRKRRRRQVFEVRAPELAEQFFAEELLQLWPVALEGVHRMAPCAGFGHRALHDLF